MITTRRCFSLSLLKSELNISVACFEGVRLPTGLVGLRQNDVALPLRILHRFLLFADQRLVYVRNDTATSDGCLDQAVQLLVSANGEL